MFEADCNLEDLKKKSLRIVVFQSVVLKKDKIVGELNVNLSTVWHQKCMRKIIFLMVQLVSNKIPFPVHSFSKKWGVLERIGQDEDKTSPGYLQIDLTIVSSFEAPAPAILQVQDDDIIEELV